MRTGVEGCGVVVWFWKYTDIVSLVLLFGFITPAYTVVLSDTHSARWKRKRQQQTRGQNAQGRTACERLKVSFK